MIRQILQKFSGVVLLLLPVFEIVYTKKPFRVNMDHLYKGKIFQERRSWYLLVKWGKQKVKGNCVFIIYFFDWKHFIRELIACCWQEINLSTSLLTDWVFKNSCNAFFKSLATVLFLLLFELNRELFAVWIFVKLPKNIVEYSWQLFIVLLQFFVVKH